MAILDGRTADKNEVGLLMATGGRDEAAADGGRRSTTDRGATAPGMSHGAPAPCSAAHLRLALLPAIAIVLALIVGAIVMILSSPLVTGGLNLGLPLDGLRRARRRARSGR